MDKETLSNYGWIVICVLVLAVMIALAGPFGNFVADAVKSTTQGLFDTNKNALDVAGIVIDGQGFESTGNQEETALEAGLYKTDGTFVPWDELIADGTIKVTNGVLTTYASGDEIFGYANNSSDALSGNLVISNTVTSLGEQALCVCINLTSVTIPDSVTNIGNKALYECHSLTSITIPDSVTTIGEDAFYYCDSLTSITIPDSVTTIGEEAFWNCTSLESITIPSTIMTISNGVFSNCHSLTSIIIPDSVTTIDNYAFSWCISLASITFEGTMAQWNTIPKVSDWNYGVPATYVLCSDGQVALS